jgi:uncharacterized sulfatase
LNIFLRTTALLLCLCTIGFAQEKKQPNILFAIADDWSYPHASAYGTPEINTPNFDRIAREGMVFSQAFTAAPQCSPNRASILTGRHIWQNYEAGTHASHFPKYLTVFTNLLEEGGYALGSTGKLWQPGNYKDTGWTRNPVGPEIQTHKIAKADLPADGISNGDYAANFDEFMEKRDKDKPFFFWYGAKEPPRRYEWESGVKAGKNPDNVQVPGFLPDNELVRKDILDYFLEIEWFDEHLGRMLKQLEDAGELDNTIVIVTGDNGMPFPRAKANLYEYGVRVPLAISWKGHIKPGQKTDALFSHIDLGPTILNAVGMDPNQFMTGVTQLPVLAGESESVRDYVMYGRERHSHSRYDNLGYPSRAIRTKDYVYIANLKYERFPAGDKEGFHDIDDCPTKTWMMENRENPASLFLEGFGRRPKEELYQVQDDMACMKNLAESPAAGDVKAGMKERLESLLTDHGDPRFNNMDNLFETYPRFNGMRPELGGFAVRGEYNIKYLVNVIN